MSQRYMRSGWGVLAVAVGMLVPGISSAQVTPPSFINLLFDENCNGHLINGDGVDVALGCQLVTDPGPGGLNNVLFYSYSMRGAPGMLAGDVRIFEPGVGGVPVLSDILRFNSNLTGGGIFIYSDLELGEHHDLADIGFPNAFNTNVVDVFEAGPEGNRGYVYTPTASQPGYLAFIPQTQLTYTFFSDTPEPGTIALMVGGSVFLYWRHRRKA